MIAVISGGIINSEQYDSEKWMEVLTGFLQNFGETPETWEIYKGEEFQLKVSPKIALFTAIHLKATIKTIDKLDVRIGIGLGEEIFAAEKITQSKGSAYSNSGRDFEFLKQQKTNLLIKSENEEFNRTINLMLALELSFMDDWSSVSAETLAYVFQNPEASQKEIAHHFKISQSNVSQRLSRANLTLVSKFNAYFRSRIEAGI